MIGQIMECTADNCEGFTLWEVIAVHNDSAWLKAVGHFVYRSVDQSDLIDLNSGKPPPRSCGDGGE